MKEQPIIQMQYRDTSMSVANFRHLFYIKSRKIMVIS